MEKEKTAVEWFVANIDWMLLKNTSLHYEMIINRAKEMEKQQIVSAWGNGYDNGACVNDETIYHGSIYYNNNFKKEKDESN